MMIVTRNDVAKAAGVSPGVVSYVLNSGPRPVAPATRQRVLDAVSALGYLPDGLARSLRTGQSDTLGVILPDAANPFFAELARSIEDAAYSSGKSVFVCNSADDLARERKYLGTLVEKRVDGIILVSTSGEEDLNDVLSVRIPIVAMDRYRLQASISTVRFDNSHAGDLATTHLVEHGHSQIHMIGGPISAAVSDERIVGYRRAMRRSGLQPLDVCSAPFTFEAGYKAATTLLDREGSTTAIVCSSDVQAIGAAAALHEHGALTPADIALTSIDGTSIGRFMRPDLTTIKQPTTRMAKLAVEAVLRPETETHHVLMGRLVVGRSCGCAQAHVPE
ncbi:LacI family DNA-binding transcriptional regulator [bacterium RCC_150]